MRAVMLDDAGRRAAGAAGAPSSGSRCAPATTARARDLPALRLSRQSACARATTRRAHGSARDAVVMSLTIDAARRAMRWTERQRAMLRRDRHPAVAAARRHRRRASARRRPDAAIGDARGARPARRDAPMPAVPTPSAARTARSTPTSRARWAALRARASPLAPPARSAQGRTPDGVRRRRRRRPHWMIVGEAPGEQEDLPGRALRRQGRPAARQHAARARPDARRRAERQPTPGLHRQHAQVPPAGQPQPGAGRARACEPFLSRQVALVQPRIILAMGRFAVQSAAAQREPIGRLRGRVHRYRGRAAGRHLPPGLPAAQPAGQGAGWDDLCLALEVARGVATAPQSRMPA